MITSSFLDAIPSIRHGFFTRQGGDSTGVFESLNCGFGSGDDLDTVRKNRAAALANLSIDGAKLVTAYQTHSAKVAIVTEPWNHDDAPHVDAMVTKHPGIVLGILTADCAPVLFTDSENLVIGAAHAGWRGAKSGVLHETVKAMKKLGAKAETITASVGPCIHQQSYEVSDSFRATFLEDDPENERYFVAKSRKGHCQFDLPGYIENRLQECSISRIDMLPFDSYTDEAMFFSFRGATHQNEDRYGRALSAIGLDVAQPSKRQ